MPNPAKYMSSSDRSDSSDRSEESDHSATIRQLRRQAEDAQDQLRMHDYRMESAMEHLAAGWQGPGGRRAMANLDEIHQHIHASYVAQIRDLEEQADDLRKADLLRQDEKPDKDGQENDKSSAASHGSEAASGYGYRRPTM